MNKATVIGVMELINKASDNVSVPTVSKQKQEFYKLGVRDLLEQLQIQLDLVNQGDSISEN